MTIFTSPQVRVSIKKQDRKTIRTVGVSPEQTNYLSELFDVDASDPDNNETLVFDAETGKYIIKTLPIISGGTF
jgi:hypothetical protein